MRDSFGPNRSRKYVLKSFRILGKKIKIYSPSSTIFFNIAWKMLTYVSDTVTDTDTVENFDRQFHRFSGWSGQTVSKYPKFQDGQFQIFVGLIFTPAVNIAWREKQLFSPGLHQPPEWDQKRSTLCETLQKRNQCSWEGSFHRKILFRKDSWTWNIPAIAGQGRRPPTWLICRSTALFFSHFRFLFWC